MVRFVIVMALSVAALVSAARASVAGGSQSGQRYDSETMETSVAQDVSVPGTRSRSNAVVVTLEPNRVAVITGIGGTVCLDGLLACTGPDGLSQSDCNGVTSDECSCPDDCGIGSYGALLRDECAPVGNGAPFITGDGSVEFFVNADCDPSNNTGQFSFTVDIDPASIFASGFESGGTAAWSQTLP